MEASFDGSTRFAEVRERIRRDLVERGVPSLAVAVAQHGVVLWEEAFGWADRERRRAATPDTLYSLASISKPITATGLMVLKARGMLDLDRPINDYLGDAQLRARVGDAADATVRRVANHTSGLPLHYHFFYADEPDRPPPFTETVRRYGNLVTAPGERFLYSNLGYGVLDHILARISGKTYSDFMRQEVFLPLGMLHASVGIAPGLEPYQAIRYGADGVPYPFYDFDHPGGSAVFASAHDLLRFGMFHLHTHLPDQKAIIGDDHITEMQEDTTGVGDTGYGFGWRIIADDHGTPTVHHTGGMGGVNTILKIVPAAGIAVVVLANGNTNMPTTISDDILAVLLPDFRERLAADRAREAEEAKKERTREPFVPPAEIVGEWHGTVHTWQAELPLTLTFKPDGDVHARLSTQLTMLVNAVRFKDGYLRGRMPGTVGTADANRRPYILALDLKLRDQVLKGALIAQSWIEGEYGGAPERRDGNALSSWVELVKRTTDD